MSIDFWTNLLSAIGNAVSMLAGFIGAVAGVYAVIKQRRHVQNYHSDEYDIGGPR